MADTSVRTFKPSPNSVVFRTQGVWSASEFSRFITAMEGIYDAFLAVHLGRQAAPSPQQQMRGYFDHWMEYFYGELERRYTERVDPYSEARFNLPSPEYFSALADQESRYLAFVYDNIRSLAPYEQLTVESVRIGSPGWFSFQGLGEPIRELREFIKDIFYRNRQERERGDMDIEHQRELNRIEIARERLKLRTEYAELLSGPANKIPVAALEQADVLERLELEGKLVDIPDNIDPETFDPGTEQD